MVLTASGAHIREGGTPSLLYEPFNIRSRA